MSDSIFTIRPMTSADNAVTASIIRKVSREYGLISDVPGSGQGFAVTDPTLDSLFEFYQAQGGHYWVVSNAQGTVLGGAGIAPLAAGEPTMGELQKMYFLPELRGRGMARVLVHTMMDWAKKNNFTHVYLETTESLPEAISLYRSMGFELLPGPLGNTGHSSCELCMLRSIE